jgi:outer membrane beta-barrel protein
MAMNQARVGLLVAAALLAVPLTASAQPKGRAAAQKRGQPKGGAAQPKADQPKEINLDEPEKPADPKAAGDAPAAADATGAATPAPDATGDAGDTGLGDICKIDPSACPTIDMDKAAKRDLRPQMYAVQQIYALRANRVEVSPYWGITMNDQFVSHPGPGLSLNYYIINTFAIGINGNLYAGLNSNSSFNFETSRAGRVGEPITEYSWNANLNLQYVPAYGKFAGFGDFIFHYDFYVLAGGGAISTRPLAVVDPDNRTFSFKIHPDIHLGGGLRIFINRWFAAMFEVSDYLFPDQLENPTIDNHVINNKPQAQNPSTWLNPGVSWTNNVQAQVGFSVFLPFSWEYRLPK